MATKTKLEAQNPLILRCQRLIEAFAKSDDERDFYLDRMEGFILYADLDKAQHDLEQLEKELKENSDRYVLIPKMTFYETKKIMEGFVNEKVYDIDTKEKLLDIIQSKEARENFLEFIYDHHAELEKWQQFYQERSRIRIIEWLRQNHFHFVFEEDLDLPKSLIEKLKRQLFDSKAGKDIVTARKTLVAKAKTYYSNEALNPRPKRGRPPKQTAKLEIEPQISTDIFITVPQELRPFLFTPDHATSSLVSFSSKFETEEDLLAHRRAQHTTTPDAGLESLNQKLASLRSLSSRWLESETKKSASVKSAPAAPAINGEEWDDEEEEEELEVEEPKATAAPAPALKIKAAEKAAVTKPVINAAPAPKKVPPQKTPPMKTPPMKTPPKKAPPVKKPLPKKPAPKKPAPKKATPQKVAPQKPAPKKVAPKPAPKPKKPAPKPIPKKAPPKKVPPKKTPPPAKKGKKR